MAFACLYSEHEDYLVAPDQRIIRCVAVGLFGDMPPYAVTEQSPHLAMDVVAGDPEARQRAQADLLAQMRVRMAALATESANHGHGVIAH